MLSPSLSNASGKSSAHLAKSYTALLAFDSASSSACHYLPSHVSRHERGDHTPKWLRMAYRSLGMGGMQRDVGEKDGGKRLGLKRLG
jgi:hypothetical protein